MEKMNAEVREWIKEERQKARETKIQTRNCDGICKYFVN